MKFIFSKEKLKHHLLSHFELISIGTYFLYVENINQVEMNERFISITYGKIYDLTIRANDKSSQFESVSHNVKKYWPLPNNISGSFSRFQIDISENQLIIATDLIGSYPLYELIYENNIVISNNLSFTSAIFNLEKDITGIAQKVLESTKLNLGRRTISKDLKRILPGEKVTFNLNSNTVKRNHDLTLFQNLSDSSSKIDNNEILEYWEVFKKDVEYHLNLSEKQEKYLALSGGMDSRIILGSVDKSIELKTFTYGPSESYEVNVARKLASLRNLKHAIIHDYENYFPNVKTLRNYQIDTESVNVMSWIDVLENFDKKPNKPMLMLGDSTESLPARNIKTHSTRKFKIKNFLYSNLLNKDFKFQENNQENFSKWKVDNLNSLLKSFTYQNLKMLNLENDIDFILTETKKDIEVIHNLIESHNLPTISLVHELFTWYTHSRFNIHQQILMCNSKFDAVCPPMSLATLRKTSNIHPNRRLNYRFMNQLFRTVPELNELNKIPTAQTPWIPRNSPDVLIFLIWGFRSIIDQFFIKRIMKTKNPNKRYRVLKSLNWIKVYQTPSLRENIEDYFTPNELSEEIKSAALNSAEERKNLTKWPLSNIDIIQIAALNQQLNFIRENKTN